MRLHGVFTLVAAAMLMAPLAACVQNSAKTATALQVKQIPVGKDSKPLAFAKVVMKMPRGRELGTVGIGFLCGVNAKITPRRGRYSPDNEIFNEVFRDELEANNYRVVGDPDALFGDPTINEAEYLVAGLIKNAQVNVCYPLAGWGDWDGTGDAFVDVEWQIFDTMTREVTYKTTTQGSHKQTDAIPDPLNYSLEEAFAMATQNLLADEKFHKMVAGDDGAQKDPYKGRKIMRIKGLSFDTSKDFKVIDVRPAVVTIGAGGTSIGSGFFINEEGFILTNYHVVKGAKTVGVTVHSGRLIPAEVIRSDRIRDVALLKIGETGHKALPLSRKEPPVGAAVLAYGTPFKKSLAGSLTRGIVSAYRSDKSGRYIQSDVNIQPGNSGGPLLDDKGNVVGISVKGGNVAVDLTGQRISTGQNFFIPIQDALEKLKLEPGKKTKEVATPSS